MATAQSLREMLASRGITVGSVVDGLSSSDGEQPITANAKFNLANPDGTVKEVSTRTKPYTVEEMRELMQFPTYKSKTEDEINQTAADYYAPVYNAEVESNKQKAAATDLSLKNQLDALLVNYGQRREDAQLATRQSLSAQDRNALNRGMQRSSYNQAANAAIRAQGDKTLDTIAGELTQQQGAIESNRQLTAQQLAETLARLDTDKAVNVANRAQELRDQDYTRTLETANAKNQLEQWLSDYLLNTYEKFAMPVATETTSSGGGGGGSGYSSTAKKTTGGSGSDYDDSSLSDDNWSPAKKAAQIGSIVGRAQALIDIGNGATKTGNSTADKITQLVTQVSGNISTGTKPTATSTTPSATNTTASTKASDPYASGRHTYSEEYLKGYPSR